MTTSVYEELIYVKYTSKLKTYTLDLDGCSIQPYH
jgi:hypothetical protein